MEKTLHADSFGPGDGVLLQESIPVGGAAAHPRAEEVLTGRVAQAATGIDKAGLSPRRHRVAGETQLLSNGTYNRHGYVAGGGYSNCGRKSRHPLA